jgi:tetratricopeptide (TPR) repeat protein
LAHSELSDYQQTIQDYEQALTIDRLRGDSKGEGATLSNLGSIYYFLGDIRRAIKLYEQRLQIARELDDRRGEGNALGNLAIPTILWAITGSSPHVRLETGAAKG